MDMAAKSRFWFRISSSALSSVVVWYLSLNVLDPKSLAHAVEITNKDVVGLS